VSSFSGEQYSADLAGIVIGGGIEDLVRNFPDDKKNWKDQMYFFSITMCLYHIADLMAGTYPNERVVLFYERGDFGGMAQRAFDSMMNDPRNAHISKYFVTMVPMGWEDCIPLQPADFIAYEGFKLVGSSLQGSERIRKSLQVMLGKEMPLTIGYFSDKTYKQWIKNKEAELKRYGFGSPGGKK